MRESRARQKKAPKNSRPDIVGKLLQRSTFLLGIVGRGAKRILMVPRSHALAEINGFLKLPEPITDDELRAVLRSNGWSDNNAGR